MKYVVRKSVVQVVGKIWMPNSVPVAQDFELSDHDVNNARDDEGKVTRESVQRWLDTHAGDFSSITDFCASIEDGDATIDIPWESEESEMTYGECMFGDGD